MSETVYYEDDGISVTNSYVSVDNNTYSINSISGVECGIVFDNKKEWDKKNKSRSRDFTICLLFSFIGFFLIISLTQFAEFGIFMLIFSFFLRVYSRSEHESGTQFYYIKVNLLIGSSRIQIVDRWVFDVSQECKIFFKARYSLCCNREEINSNGRRDEGRAIYNIARDRLRLEREGTSPSVQEAEKIAEAIRLAIAQKS